MKEQLFEMTRVVGLWFFLFLISYLLTRIFGVRGNQLIRCRRFLEQAHIKSSLVLREMNRKKKNQFKYVGKINHITIKVKKALAHLDIYVFDHRENKRIGVPRQELFELLQSYKQLVMDYAKEDITAKGVVSSLKELDEETLSLIDNLTKELERLDKLSVR